MMIDYCYVGTGNIMAKQKKKPADMVAKIRLYHGLTIRF